MKIVSVDASPRPEEPDVHLSIHLHGVRMDFVACLTAAFRFAQDWHIRQGHGAVTVIPGDTDGLRRLPNERLYLL
ncbi:hypothetical protein OHB12_29635 [Nocardia sp. NBC_01730]|uniref:hypothetical protein n=1 Tax=Nocardia sp. NBC_01730 TaxID=2975998 RepID=UPI002E0D92EC|nr:hypothetical protein OHB12_29635 [Nocardia sp. NBC_01730]